MALHGGTVQMVTFRQACVTRVKECAEQVTGTGLRRRERVTWVRVILPLHTSVLSVGFRSRPTLGIAGHEGNERKRTRRVRAWMPGKNLNRSN